MSVRRPFVLLAGIAILGVLMAMFSTGVLSASLNSAERWVAWAASVNVQSPDPPASTDHAVVRWDSTGGDKTLDSGVIIDNSDNVSGVANLSVGGNAGIGVNANAVKLFVSGDGNGAGAPTDCIFAVQNDAYCGQAIMSSEGPANLHLLSGAKNGTFSQVDTGLMTLTTDEFSMQAAQIVKRYSVNANYSIGTTDYYVTGQPTGNINITLPSGSSSAAGKVYVVKNIATSGLNTVTVKVQTGDKLDSVTNGTRVLNPLKAVTVVSDNSGNWEIISAF